MPCTVTVSLVPWLLFSALLLFFFCLFVLAMPGGTGDYSSQTRGGTHIPPRDAWSLNPWTKEVPVLHFLNI